MKKLYIAPEFDLHKVTLQDVLLASPTEGTIPQGGDLDPTLPPDDPGEEVDF